MWKYDYIPVIDTQKATVYTIKDRSFGCYAGTWFPLIWMLLASSIDDKVLPKGGVLYCRGS